MELSAHNISVIIVFFGSVGLLVGGFNMEKKYRCHDVKLGARMLCAYSDVSPMSPPVPAHLGNTA